MAPNALRSSYLGKLLLGIRVLRRTRGSVGHGGDSRTLNRGANDMCVFARLRVPMYIKIIRTSIPTTIRGSRGTNGGPRTLKVRALGVGSPVVACMTAAGRLTS